ncbi:formylglycine-generating enzyme family protein [bacterium]|nr:formylglycine-generating enzyme family protein [bacterium]MDB4730000.1 formylglycine-generating enzyme family protein [bacterium]
MKLHLSAWIVTTVALITSTLNAQVPQMISYQGRVAVGDPQVNFDGTGEFRFALVNANGSTSYWSNDGTSTDGSEPTGAVSLPVTKGLYSVLLGANMTPIPSSVFANPDVHLRVWFDDGTNGSQLLTPDQRIAAVGYAMVASTVPDGAITSDKLGSGLTLGGTTSGTFSGDGSGLTNIPASAIVSTVSPAGMVLIPGGEFAMGRQSGDGQSDELPVHTVMVSAFYMDKFEVTKALWDDVKAYADANGYTFDNAGSGQGAFHPVHSILWFDMVKWCNARSEKEGLTPVYYTDDAQTTLYRTGHGDPNVQVKWSANGYRLPTEAEWEKAARGPLVANTYPWGNVWTGADTNYYGSGDPFDYPGNWRDQSPFWPSTTPVGYYDGDQVPAGVNRANGYGLYDMAGNLAERCWDWYDPSWYSDEGATEANPRGPEGGGSRVVRGGSWATGAPGIQPWLSNPPPPEQRCADRSDMNVWTHYNNIAAIGFRCVRGL